MEYKYICNIDTFWQLFDIFNQCLWASGHPRVASRIFQVELQVVQSEVAAALPFPFPCPPSIWKMALKIATMVIQRNPIMIKEKLPKKNLWKVWSPTIPPLDPHPRVWSFSPRKNLPPLGATFKAVLIAVDMTKTLQARCKTCFGGPKMILNALWKILFQKSSTFLDALASLQVSLVSN